MIHSIFNVVLRQYCLPLRAEIYGAVCEDILWHRSLSLTSVLFWQSSSLLFPSCFGTSLSLRSCWNTVGEETAKIWLSFTVRLQKELSSPWFGMISSALTMAKRWYYKIGKTNTVPTNLFSVDGKITEFNYIWVNGVSTTVTFGNIWIHLETIPWKSIYLLLKCAILIFNSMFDSLHILFFGGGGEVTIHLCRNFSMYMCVFLYIMIKIIIFLKWSLVEIFSLFLKFHWWKYYHPDTTFRRVVTSRDGWCAQQRLADHSAVPAMRKNHLQELLPPLLGVFIPQFMRGGCRG